MTLGVTNDENYNDIADALREVGVGMSDATFTPSQMAPAIRGLRSIWGNIEGQLANQSDLQNALNAKANSADLGDMAAEDDAPSDDKQYGRKNGDWVPITDELANWGQIAGTLSNQTDLQNALDSKAPLVHDHDDRYYTESEIDEALALKADADSVYTKTETDALLDEKADASSVYTKTETDTLLDEKADADSVYTKTETDTLLDEKADADSVYDKTETDIVVRDGNTAATGYASGAVASFDDGADLAFVKNLKVAVDPVQAGTGDPSPDNIRPITGWTGCNITRANGKNLFNKASNDYLRSAYFDTQHPITLGQSGRRVYYMPCKPNTTYTVSRLAVATNERFYFGYTYIHPAEGVAVYNVKGAAYSQTIGNLMSITLTTDNTAKYLVIYAYWGSQVEALDTLQIEEGSTATTYEAFIGTTLPISWETEAGTVYGGVLDVTAGTMTVDRKYVSIDDTTDWKMYASNKFYADNVFSDDILHDVNVSGYLSNLYLFSGTGNTQSSQLTTDKRFYTSYYYHRIWVYDSQYESLDTFKAALVQNPLQVVYPLAEPLTIPLTSAQMQTLLGENHIWADTGDVEVTYCKDTETYVTSEINAHHDDTKAPVITETASGNVASFTDGSTSPVTALTVAIEPVQDLHGYDNPWAAGGGKNILAKPINYVGDVPNTLDECFFIKAGTYTVSAGSITGATSWRFGIRMKDSSGNDLSDAVNKPNQYSTWNTTNHCWLGGSNTTSLSLTITIATDCYIRIVLAIGDVSSSTVANNAQLESGSTATSFAPYENICPISGWTGTRIFKTRKNLLNPENWIATRVTVDENGVYTFTAGGYNADLYTGQNGSNHVIPSSYFDKLPYLPAGTYTWSFKYISGGAVRGVSKVDKNGNKSSLSSNYAIKGDYYEVHFTLTEPSMINIERLSSETPAVFSEPQLELGSQRTAYEPYVGDVLPISWETEAGTVYGGVLDVLTGMLTVTHGYADLGALSWSYRGDNYNAFYTYDIRYIKSNDVEDNYNILCSGYKCVYKTNWHLENKVITAWNSFAVGNIIVKDTSYGTDASAFKAGVSGVQLVYKLKTPITVQLSPSQLNTLLGENHIWADTGDVNVTYRADTKLFIQGQIAESQRATRSLIAGIETSNTATKNYSSGDLVIVGDQLLKFTANTASGSTITVGSNVVVTTVAEQLLFLASA